MAAHDTEPTTATVQCVPHDFQGPDIRPATDRALSAASSFPHISVADRSSDLHESCDTSSTNDTIADAEDSSAANQTETFSPPDAVVVQVSPAINTTNQSSDVDVAEATQEKTEAGSSPDPILAVAEDPATTDERVEIFRFTDLAPEIRNRIYRFILGPPQDPSICLTQILDKRPLGAQSEDIDIDNTFRIKTLVPNPKHNDPNWGFTHEVDPNDLSILLASKQIYTEACLFFYATNCFSFTDTGLLYRFLKNIGYTRRQHLTMIYFLWRGEDAKEAFRLLKTCRRLTSVQFTVPCSHPPGYEALKEVKAETAKARALVHFTAPQLQHSSCFGDYQCHCNCNMRSSYAPASNLQEIEQAMMRPRRKQDLPEAEEVFDLFNPKREYFKRSEDQELLGEKAAFNEFIDRIEWKGARISYLGYRNKTLEASQHQTLKGQAADDYFRDFAAKLAADRRQVRREEYWGAKHAELKEQKEQEEQRKREAKEAKELAIKRRKVVRALKLKFARDNREQAKKMAREATELKRRTVREAKEREKMMAREAKALKKKAGESKPGDEKKTKKGSEEA